MSSVEHATWPMNLLPHKAVIVLGARGSGPGPSGALARHSFLKLALEHSAILLLCPFRSAENGIDFTADSNVPELVTAEAVI